MEMDRNGKKSILPFISGMKKQRIKAQWRVGAGLGKYRRKE